MSELQERIAQYRKMANDDPDNELGPFTLGKLLMEDGQFDEAVKAFRRTLEINSQFSKVFQLLGSCLLKLNRRDEAVKTWRQGFEVAEERGDRVPRDEMARLLVEAGEPKPESRKPAVAQGVGDGFRCQRPGCMIGSRARQLPAAPMNDALGRRIQDSICADCWNAWLKDYSIKVINEMRLDLSTERGQDAYDQVMKEFLGVE